MQEKIGQSGGHCFPGFFCPPGTLHDGASLPGTASCISEDESYILEYEELGRTMKRIRAAVPLALLSFTLLFSQCSRKFSPTAPTWDTDLRLPLFNRTHTLAELVDKNPDKLSADSGQGGLIVYSRTDLIGSFIIGSDIRVYGKSGRFGGPVGVISVSAPSPTERTITLLSIAPQLAPFQGTATQVLPFSFGPVASDSPPIAEYLYFEGEGQLAFIIVNRLPIPADTLRVTLSDSLGVIADRTYAQIVSPGDSLTDVVPLGRRVYGNHFALVLRGHTPGSATPVTVAPSRGIDVRAALRDLTLYSALARISPMTVTHDTSIVLGDSVDISEGVVGSGQLTYRVSNQTALRSRVVTSLPGLVKDGFPYRDEFTLMPHTTSAERRVDLSGYTVSLPGGALHFLLEASTEGTGDQYVEVRDTDSFTGTFQLSDLLLVRATGRVKPFTTAFAQSGDVTGSEVSSEFDGTVELGDGRMILRLGVSTSGVKVRVSGVLTARDKSGTRSAALTVPSTLLNSPHDSIVLTQQNSSLLTFLNTFGTHLPAHYTFGGTAFVNPTYAYGSIARDDSAVVEADIIIPTKLRISGGHLRDTSSISSEGDTTGLWRVRSAMLYLTTRNRIPLKGGMELLFTDETYRPLIRLPKPGQDSLTVAAAQTDASGEAQMPPVETTRSIAIDRTDLDLIQRSTFILVDLFFETPAAASRYVRFRTSDFIELHGKLEAGVRIAAE